MSNPIRKEPEQGLPHQPQGSPSVNSECSQPTRLQGATGQLARESEIAGRRVVSPAVLPVEAALELPVPHAPAS